MFGTLLYVVRTQVACGLFYVISKRNLYCMLDVISKSFVQVCFSLCGFFVGYGLASMIAKRDSIFHVISRSIVQM